MKQVMIILAICVCQIKVFAQNILLPKSCYNVELEDSAMMGNTDAQFEMGKYYYQQYNTLVDNSLTRDKARFFRTKAAYWFKKAVSKGHIDAMYGLSQTYRDPYEGVLNDSLYFWLEKAASSGNADALYELYTLYDHGETSKTIVFKKDKKKAEGYLQKAFEKGCVQAYARMYYRNWKNGKGIEYLKLWAEKKDSIGLDYLALEYQQGRWLPKDLSKALKIWNNLHQYDRLKDYYFSVGDSAKAIELLGKIVDSRSWAYASYSELIDLAKYKNNPIAQYWMAIQKNSLFFERLEKGKISNNKDVEPWLLKSANQNYAPAMGKLAYCYVLDHGWGDSKWEKEGFQWALKGAELGDAFSMYVVGLCYSNGYGARRDKNEAAKWYIKSAEKGHIAAQLIAADIFLKGENGIQQDSAKAVAMYEMAAAEGNVSALNELGCIYEDQGAFKKSYDCFLKAANMMDSYARFRLGLHYYYSFNSRYDNSSNSADSFSNIEKGLRFFHAADSMGNANAPFYIGEAYENGYGVKRDTLKAMEYYKKSADKGLNYSCYYLGKIYYEGKLVDKNYNDAFKYLKIAAENKNNPIGSAMRLLAACYRYGLGTKIDKEKEAYWMEEAKNHKDEQAMRIMNQSLK